MFFPDKLFQSIVTNTLAWYENFVNYGQKSFITLPQDKLNSVEGTSSGGKAMILLLWGQRF
jgi:hypothetical protein